MQKDSIDEVIDDPKIRSQFQRLWGWMATTLDIIKTINDAARKMNFSAGFKDAAAAFKEAQKAADDYKAARAEAVRLESEIRQEILKNKAAMEALKLAEAQERAERKKRKADIQAEAGSLAALRKELAAVRAQWDAMGPASRRANSQMLKDIKSLDAEVRKLEAQTGRFQRNVGNYPRFAGGVTGMLGAFGITVGAGAIAKQIFDTTVKLDSLDAALQTASVSAEEFSRNQEFISNTSERLGLNVLGTTSSFTKFYAASTLSGISASTTRDIFSAVAGAAAKMSLSQDDANGVFLAFSQIASKGKVQAEELRGQIGERIPGAFAIAARAIGVTEEQLNKMLEKGEVVASTFLPKFATEMARTFGVDNNTRVETLRGSIERLNKEFTDLVKDNQSGLSQFFKMIIDGTRTAVQGFNYMAASAINFFKNIAKTRLTTADGKPYDPDDPLGAIAEDKARQERLKALESGNDAFIEKFKKASAKEREVMMQEAERTARLSLAMAKKAPLLLPGGPVTNLAARIDEFGISSRASDDAYQDADRLTRYRKILAEEAALNRPAAEKGPTQKELNEAARRREMVLKAILEANKINIQAAIDMQREIAENDKNSYEVRINAAENYAILKESLTRKTSENERRLLEEEIKNGHAVAEQRKVIDEQLQSDLAANRRDSNKLQLKIEKDNLDDSTKAILENLEEQKTLISNRANEELAFLQEQLKKKNISQEQYEAEKLRIENAAHIKELQAEIEATARILEVRKAAGEKVVDQENKILDLNNKIKELDVKYTEDAEKAKTDITKKEADKRLEIQKQVQEKVNELIQEGVGLIFDIGSASFERQKNLVQEQIDEIDRLKEKEIERAKNSIASDQERADKIAVINASAQSKKEALERRQRQIDQQKAAFEKARAIFEISVNTAIAVSKVSPNPILMALAAALGAIQISAVASKPIPRYKHGTSNHPGGPMIVGDGGINEVVQTPSGQAFLTPDTDTIMNFPRGTKVFPSLDDFYKFASLAAFKPLPIIDDTMVANKQLARDIVTGVGGKLDVLNNSVKNRTPVKVYNWTKSGITSVVEENGATVHYINKYMG